MPTSVRSAGRRYAASCIAMDPHIRCARRQADRLPRFGGIATRAIEARQSRPLGFQEGRVRQQHQCPLRRGNIGFVCQSLLEGPSLGQGRKSDTVEQDAVVDHGCAQGGRLEGQMDRLAGSVRDGTAEAGVQGQAGIGKGGCSRVRARVLRDDAERREGGQGLVPSRLDELPQNLPLRHARHHAATPRRFKRNRFALGQRDVQRQGRALHQVHRYLRAIEGYRASRP